MHAQGLGGRLAVGAGLRLVRGNRAGVGLREKRLQAFEVGARVRKDEYQRLRTGFLAQHNDIKECLLEDFGLDIDAVD